MDGPGLPQWTLSVRIDDDALRFTLGDGRRLAWHGRQPANLLRHAMRPMPAADLLGIEIARRLAESPPRILNVQFEQALDGIAWEALGLANGTLAEQFAIGRHPVSTNESPPVPPAPLADALSVTAVFGEVVLPWPFAHCIAIESLEHGWARDMVATAHVLVLHGVSPARLLEQVRLPREERLVVMRRARSSGEVGSLLDDGAAVLCLAQAGDLVGKTLEALLHQLGSGMCVGDAVRSLHRRAAPVRLDARLYGDPGVRFVRVQTPTSRRQVTSLSFDIAGSTTLLRQLGDEAYAEMLDRLHARCTDVVRRYGGRPDDPQGDDGVMCYFGYPSAVEDAAVHAVAAGLEIVRTGLELDVPIRVGIATGLVVIKADQPVGLSIHYAARLQQATFPGTVLTSESTRRLVAHAFDLEPLGGSIELKGIDVQEDLFRVTGASRDAKAHRLERLPSLTPLVGRREELMRLRRSWQRMGGGECHLAIVRGEPGIGKSRLVREFRHQLVQSGVQVMECRCRADASASPYLTLAEALRRWLDIDLDDPSPDAMARLAAALPEGAREGEPLALMSALLGLTAQPPRTMGSRSRGQLLALLLDWFTAFAKDRPCCMIIEDWHWVDPSMRELVERLLDRRQGPSLLIVVTSRNEGELPSGPGPVERIELGGLTPDAAREMVAAMCANAPLSAGLVHMLASRADGVPLFLEEATRMALELEVDRSAAGIAALETVPASLQDLLMARLDGLGPAKQVAQVGAVIGREFSLPLLTALMEESEFALDTVTLGEQLATLVGSGLVRAQGSGQYTFKHALVRDAAYESLWARDRHGLHARVVRLLKSRWPEVAQQRPELLAHHQTEAGLNTEALAQWELAARNAAARSADLEAISHLRRALGVLSQVEPGLDRDRTALRLQLLLAGRLIATEGYGADAVLRAYVEAQRLCDEIGDETARFKIEMGLESYRFMRADFAAALEHGRRAAEIATRSGDIRQRLNAHWGLACTLFHQGALRATMREMETGLSLYKPEMHAGFGVQDPGVMCMAYSSWGLWELGRPDSALARIDRAVEMATAFQHKFSQAVALAYGVSVLMLRGETDAALDRAHACLDVCENSGFPVWWAITRCMRGRLLCEQGAFDLGLSELSAGYAMWLSTGALVSRPFGLAMQAEGLMLADQVDAAAACIDEGLGIVDRIGERQLESELRRLRGEVARLRDDRVDAEVWLKSAYALAMRQHRLGFALRSATSLARVWAADGKQEKARRLLGPLVARWAEGRGTRDVREALALCESLQ